MKFGVVTFPGSNCDEDIRKVLKTMDGVSVINLWHKDTSVQGCKWVILPGGFSYGDYLRSGAIAQFSPIMRAVGDHVKKGGYVLGICNGFQILTEAGLLPGTLLQNTSHRFICKNVHLKVGNSSVALTCGLPTEQMSYKIPIAHGQGRFFAPEDTMQRLKNNGQIVFYYSDQRGNINQESNPNGSLLNIAGVSDETNRVFGMMPHPERAADPRLNNTDGQWIFESMIKNS